MITQELLQKVRRIEIRTRRLVNDILAGEYHAVFKGRGVEFAEVRSYQYGDDIRSIDWNVTARMGSPYIKRFVEERELTVFLLVDASGSMEFGTRERFKSELAAELAAVLAFSAIKNNDRVGLIIFTDRKEKFIPPKKGKNHVLRLIREILTFDPVERGTDVAMAIEYLHNIQKRKCVAFLLSDFLDLDPDRELRLAGRKHDMVAVKISDLGEESLPPIRGRFLLEDPETGETLERNLHTRVLRKQFEEDASSHTSRLRNACRRFGLGYIPIKTGEDYVVPLVRFFEKRATRY